MLTHTIYEAPSSAYCHFLPPNTLFTLFSDIFNLCSFLGVRDQVSHPYKTTSKITVSYILIKFLEKKGEDKRF